ncbi:DUF7342 family protein [Halovenus sp. HT40]|uniref:DUF7342 family protein n=1 Tax=Halovenus sp. HT40 TaxID=3126691 RepID=UPI00300F6182
MPEITEGSPPEPPFEANDEPVEEPEGKMRERVRQVLPSVTEPAKVSTIGEMADCSAEGARNALREYDEMGLVTKTNDNPEKYKRNPEYFRFLRGHRLAEEHTTDELRSRLADAYRKHSEFAEQFGADSPDEVEVDERESRERFEEVFEWEALLSEADDLREAYRQQTGTMPPAFEDVATKEQIDDEIEFTPEVFENLQLVSPIYIPGVLENLPELIERSQKHTESVEKVAQNISELTATVEQMEHSQTDAGE